MTQLVPRNPSTAVAPAQPERKYSFTHQEAIAMAKSKLIPTELRGDDGAILLLQQWAEHHDVTVFEAMWGVHIIKGRPEPSASMRRQMATQKGFELETTEWSDERVTIQVWDCRGGQRTKRGEPITADIKEIPPAQIRNNAKWSGAPAEVRDMLFAQACRWADKLHIQTAASWLDAATEDLYEAPDQLAEFAEPTEAPEPEVVEVEEAEVVEVAEEQRGELTAETVLAMAEAKGIKETKLKIELNKMHNGANLDTATTDQLADLADWIESA